MKNDKKKVGLALSGGGYRATAYHLGTFRKLKEMGVLDKVDVISTVSGGSIIGATYGLHSDNFEEFDRIINKGVRSSVIWGVVTSFRFLMGALLLLGVLGVGVWSIFWTPYPWISLIAFAVFALLIWFFQFDILPISDINEKMYDRFFFQGKKLSDFRKDVDMAINSTNLETGRLFTFSREKMNDSTYEYMKPPVEFKNEEFPISRAVAASSCVPFAFTPIEISKRFFKNSADYHRVYPRLVDGGVYDNQGGHKLTQRNSSYACDTVIISDAGRGMTFEHRYKNIITLLVRTSDLFMNRIKNMQMIEYLYENYLEDRLEIGYQSLGWNLEGSVPSFMNMLKEGQILEEVWKAHGISQADIDNKEWDKIEEKVKSSIGYDAIMAQALSKEDLEIARSVGTNLTALKDIQVNTLIGHASAITEMQVKLFCPSLLN